MTKEEFSKILDETPHSIFYFYTPECKHCKELTPIIRSYGDITNTKIYFINTFDEEEISDLFEIEYVPVLTVVAEGHEGLDYNLYEGPESIKEFLL